MKLTKSQRVTLLKDIASRMSEDDWTMIDLTLSQFGFPTSDTWSGGEQAYVLKMTDSAKDDELVELAAHFGMETPSAFGPAAPADAPYWEEGKLKVFISHLTAEKKQASDFKDAMSDFGMSGFVAHADINPTKEWQLEIETALATSDLLVALVHPAFVSSPWCDQEIGYALGRGVPVFTVKCGADPHGFVSRFQAFNGNGKSSKAVTLELFEAAISHKKLQTKMADVLVGLFLNSNTFADAKARVSYLESLTVWDDSYSKRLLKGVDNNDQISGSWGTPERVKKLVKKWKET